MNINKNIGKEQIDCLTDSIVDDIREMSDEEISSFSCDVVGDEKSAAIKFDSIIESAMVSQKKVTLTEVGKKLKELSSSVNHQAVRLPTSHKQGVSEMIQRNEEITTFAAQKVVEVGHGATTMVESRKKPANKD